MTIRALRPPAPTAILVFSLFGCALLVRVLTASPLRWPLGGAMLTGYGAMAIWVAAVDGGVSRVTWTHRPGHPIGRVVTGVLIGVGLVVVGGLASVVSGLLGVPTTTPDGSAGTLPLLALGFLLAAPVEEWAFRGALQSRLAARIGPTRAVWAQATVFAAYHLAPGQLLPGLAYGLILGEVARRDGSLLRSTVAHLILNALGLLLYSSNAS
jgi:membrane protease YdiL (CAAX protease family)